VGGWVGEGRVPGRPSADRPGPGRRIMERRRSRRTVLLAVGCLAGLGIVVPRLTDTGPGEAAPPSRPVVVTGSAPASGLPGGSTTVPADGGILGGRTRGSLADDRAFVAGVRALSWAPQPQQPDDGFGYHPPDPPVETRTVVFAGDVSGDRWALVVSRLPYGPGAGPGQLMAAWFAGPADAGPDEMTLRSGPNGIAPDWPIAATDPRTGALVVVTYPGDVVEVSERPLIAADGSTSRDWQEAETVDGVAVTRVSPFARPYDGSTSFRVLRGGRPAARDVPWSFDPGILPTQPLTVEFPRGRPSEVGERAARDAAGHVLDQLGLSPAQVEITAQWVGSVPAGEAGQAAVVTVTLPSGAVVAQGEVLSPDRPDGATTGAFCGQAILPAGPPAGRRVEAMNCEVVDVTTGAPMSASLVVVAPAEVTLIRTYDSERRFLSEHAAVDGILVVPLPLGTDTVEAVTAAGVTLGRVELLGRMVDFGD
jgi:hypothetical protein